MRPASALFGMTLLASALVPSITGAQQPVLSTGTIDVGIGGATITNGFGNWESAYARASLQAGPATVVFPEIVVSRQFHDNGTYLGLGATHTLNPDWYLFGAVATSAGGFYLPRFRAGATLNRKLLPSRRLVLNVGGAYIDAKDPHHDVAASAGAAYYFTAPWIVEGGVSSNWSQPGNVRSRSGFGALTEGRDGNHYIVLRYGGGNEAYQILAPGNAVADFRSNVLTLSWRQWLKRHGGFVVSGEHYTNPFYRRSGFTVGGFWDIR
jgi:YaiO family outer membrane protein